MNTDSGDLRLILCRCYEVLEVLSNTEDYLKKNYAIKISVP